MNWIPDDLKHPSGGEGVDQLANDAVKLAHRVLERFPDVKRRHMFLAGGAAISSALIAAAGVAVVRRIRAGAKPDDAVKEVTQEELEGLRLIKRERYRPITSPTAPEAGAETEAIVAKESTGTTGG